MMPRPAQPTPGWGPPASMQPMPQMPLRSTALTSASAAGTVRR